jgi:outer membrane protein TolC
MCGSVLALALFAVPAVAGAQGASAAAQAPSAAAAFPPGMVRVTFEQAIAMAVEHNPSVAQAAQGILKAQALLNQASALIKPNVVGGVTATFLNTGQSIGGVTTTAQNQVAGEITVTAPLIAPVQWALRVQASDSKRVAELSAADVRKQVAVSTAQACLAIIALRQVLDADLRARDVAKAHYEDAKERLVAGSGSKLNELRAQQSMSADRALVEASQTNLYRAQEALGVLLAVDGPADLVDEPALDVPPSIDAAAGALVSTRTDLRLLSGREQAAARVLSDSWKDWLPSVGGLFTPQVVAPQTLFQPRFSWRAEIVATVPLFDFGYRSSQKAQRQVDLDTAKIAEDAAARQARSDVRTARDGLEAAERALGFAREAATEARQVVEIVLVSFRVGASTNIEVIDAQRVALDADTAVATADHDVRQVRLSLLVALGLFPRS